jgi:anaphase-promoting complex subunit 8
MPLEPLKFSLPYSKRTLTGRRSAAGACSASLTFLACRLEGIDVYSNILYSRGEEGKADLSMLAQRAIAVDRYTPETCVVVGNYFSMMGKHEKAVQYFQRALVLNPEYLSAYTLMGHEFIETKNTSAALQAYRRALAIDDSDYRAWYGLGQTYELLHQNFHSLFYFRQAARLRPRDARMFVAVGASCR